MRSTFFYPVVLAAVFQLMTVSACTQRLRHSTTQPKKHSAPLKLNPLMTLVQEKGIKHQHN